MGVIEDVYEDIETDVSFERFEEAVTDKVEKMGGLTDEETAAELIKHELKDQEVGSIADIEPGMDEVKFLGKILSIGETRTFERDDDEDADGKVCNVELADASGNVRAALWDKMADSATEQLDVGDVLRVKGRPKEGFNGLEVSVDQAEPELDADVDVKIQDTYTVEELSLGLSDVNLMATVLETEQVRTFDRDDGSEGRVSNLVVGDETDRVRVTLWDGMADRATELDTGTSIEVVDGYVRERDGGLELHVGERGAIEEIDDDIEYVPDTTTIADVEIDDIADIGGGVIETDSKNTFDRDDGSTGQVRNVRLKDDTGEIRVALWGDKADQNIELADEVVVTDAEIQEGFRDDVEASAGWRSTVSVVGDSAATDRSSSNASQDSSTDANTGLGAFSGADTDANPGGEPTDDTTLGAGTQEAAAGGTASRPGDTEMSGSSSGSGSSPSSGSTTGAEAGHGASSSADQGDGRGEPTADEASGNVEFTGTVVQAGNPVVLDDGKQTKSVETDAELRLGETVTVRGSERDGRIDADDVF